MDVNPNYDNAYFNLGLLYWQEKKYPEAETAWKKTLEINPDYQPKKGIPAVHSPLGELYLPLEGLIDVGAEKARLKKELDKAEVEIAKVQQKLNNPAFTQKVPANVLAEHQKRLADWQAKRDRAQAALAALEG